LPISPYLNRFLQPDNIIPSVANPQSGNRYSYVANRPVNFNDPSGHRPCGDGETYNCDGSFNIDTPPILYSQVVVLFGNPGKAKNNAFGLKGGKNSSQGVGTVTNNKFTLTMPKHVYMENATEMVVVVNGKLVRYKVVDLETLPCPGDCIIVKLPSALPGDVRPAHASKGYRSATGQSLLTVYVTEVYEGGDQYLISNRNKVLNEGDSGGAVFYNNQWIGMNASYLPGEQATVAPLCFKNMHVILSWLWNSNQADPC
jgi:hypothetical protein